MHFIFAHVTTTHHIYLQRFNLMYLWTSKQGVYSFTKSDTAVLVALNRLDLNSKTYIKSHFSSELSHWNENCNKFYLFLVMSDKCSSIIGNKLLICSLSQ
jgi:hypothetical protein